MLLGLLTQFPANLQLRSNPSEHNFDSLSQIRAENTFRDEGQVYAINEYLLSVFEFDMHK